MNSAIPMNDWNQKSSSQAQPYVVSIELQFNCMSIAKSKWQWTTTDSTLTHFDYIHIHPFCSTPPNHTVLIVHVDTFILYSVGDHHVSTVHSITARIPCPNCCQLTFILQLPTTVLPTSQNLIGLPTVSHKHSFYYSIETTMSQLPPNIHSSSTTAIANMYNLFPKRSFVSHAFVCQILAN